MRRLMRFGAIVAVVLLVLLVAVVIWIDRIAKIAVEQGSTYALGVPTSLESANVRILGGEFAMSGLHVANPEGFKTDHFMTLDQGDVALRAGSLMADTVELPTLTLSGIDMNMEKKDGKSNYKVILENLKRFESNEKTEPTESKKFVVRKLLIKDVNVHMDFMGGTLDVPVEKVELNDVGSGGKPIRLSDLTGVILKAVFAAVIQKGGELIPDDISSELSNSLSQLSSLAEVAEIGELSDFGIKTVDDVANVAKDIDEASKQVDKALGGIDDLFGGDKKKKK